MYEKRHQEMAPRSVFLWRLARSGGIAFLIVSASLGMGVFGYRYFEGLDWIDALLNASMILGGMRPVGELKTACGKLFASFYALFSGIVFLVIMGVLFAPVIHRFLHRFHLEDRGR
jgi:hypothetical protein